MAEHLAVSLGVRGLVVTLSTACSSAAVALGQHASVSATATALAARAVQEGVLPFGPAGISLRRRRLLLLRLGAHATAVEVFA